VSLNNLHPFRQLILTNKLSKYWMAWGPVTGIVNNTLHGRKTYTGQSIANLAEELNGKYGDHPMVASSYEFAAKLCLR
jgi:hypothetical protein